MPSSATTSTPDRTSSPSPCPRSWGGAPALPRQQLVGQGPAAAWELHLRLGAATSELSQRLGRAPTASELAAAELRMDREEVVEGLVAGSSYNTLSIDSGGSGDEDAPAIVDTLGDFDLSLDQIENREALRPLLAALPERERTVLLLRFFESLTQTQIAERVGVSQMHVSRLLSKSLARLRDQMQ